MKQKVRFTIVLLALVIVMGVISVQSGKSKSSIPYAESLGEVIAVIDGEELLLQDMAFYIAYEENLVEADALIYNPKNTRQYWGIHTNGSYVITEAKQAAINMAVHDALLWRLAVQEGVALDEEEERRLANSQDDFWSDLEDIQKKALAVDREIINESMEKMALAEKYQYLLAEMNEKNFEDYSITGGAYQELLEEHACEIKEETWDRVKFGNITVGSGIKSIKQ